MRRLIAKAGIAGVGCLLTGCFVDNTPSLPADDFAVPHDLAGIVTDLAEVDSAVNPDCLFSLQADTLPPSNGCGKKDTGVVGGQLTRKTIMYDGRSYTAIQFGEDSYVSFKPLDLPANSLYTLNTIVQPDRFPVNGLLYIAGAHHSNARGIAAVINNSGQALCLKTVNNIDEFVQSTKPLSTTTPTRVTCVYDNGNRLSVYLDGQLDASRTVSPGLDQPKAPFVIGALLESGNTPQAYFTGAILNAQVFKAVLP